MICCDGDTYNCTPGGGGGGGPSGTWAGVEIWSHSPGFFSCGQFQGDVLLGTYWTCISGHAQVIRLSDHHIISQNSGESVYHIRNQEDAYCYLPHEQGSLYKLTSISGTPTLIESRHYVMGYYDALDYGGHRYSLEKATVYPPNETMIRKDGSAWLHTHGWKAKDMVQLNNSLYFAATGVHNDIKATICRVDIGDKSQHFYKVFNGWTGYLCTYDGLVWVTFNPHGATVYNNAGQVWTLDGNAAWFIGEVNGHLLATSTEGDWRSCSGPSYVYEFNGTDFIKVLTVPDAEPWNICAGATADKFYFVTRNQCEWCGMGRVYELTRTT